MPDKIQSVTLILSLGDEARPTEVNQMTTQLYDVLLKSKADSVTKPPSKTLEQGAKGDPITIGAIVLGVSVAVAPK